MLAWPWAALPGFTPESWAGTGVQEVRGALVRGGPVSPEGGPQTSTLLLALPFQAETCRGWSVTQMKVLE